MGFAIAINTFRGEIRAVDPRLIPVGSAQSAVNAKLWKGKLEAWRDFTTVGTSVKVGVKKALYRYADTYWFNWLTDVNVVPAPFPGDTVNIVMFTGDGVPKFTYSSIGTAGPDYPTNDYNLGLPAPAATPTATASARTGVITGATHSSGTVTVTDVGHGLGSAGDTKHITIVSVAGMTDLNASWDITVVTADTFTVSLTTAQTYTSGGTWTQTWEDDELESRAYVYTYVQVVGAVAMEGPASLPSTVVECGVDQRVAVANMSTAPAGDYNVTLKRIYRTVAGTGGTAEYRFVAEIAVATTSYNDDILTEDLDSDAMESEFWIAPPTDLHSLVEFPGGIMAGASGKSVYFTDPYAPHAWPVANRYTVFHTIVGLGVYGNTCVVLTIANPYVITGVEPDQMTLDKVEFFQACVAKRSIIDMGDYILYASPDGVCGIGPGMARILSEGVFDFDAWAALTPTSMFGARYNNFAVMCYTDGATHGAIMFDPRRMSETLTSFSFATQVTALWTDPKTGELFVAQGDNIREFDVAATKLTYTWTSGITVFPYSTNLGAARVRAETYPVTLRVYATLDDGQEKEQLFTVEDSRPFRLQAGWLARDWWFEIEGTYKVNSVHIGQTIEDLAR